MTKEEYLAELRIQQAHAESVEQWEEIEAIIADIKEEC